MVNAYLRTPLWGTQFHDPSISNMFSGEAMLAQMLRFERAWTLALLAVESIDQRQADAAIAVIEGFKPDNAAFAQGANQDGLPVPELVRQLRSALPESDRKAIHNGSTSQDVLDTSFVLACLAVLDLFQARLQVLITGLDDLQSRFGDTALMGRTRMQAALPIGVAQRIETWRKPMQNVLNEFSDLKTQTACVQVGGAVGDRAFARDDHDGRILHTMCTELGLSPADVWHTDRSRMLDLGHWLTKTAGACAKIGKDIGLMAQQGIEEVKLSGSGGSSAMPHKQNPVRAENLTALGRFVAGQNAILAQAMIHEQERSGEAWALEWLTLPTMFEATGASLNAAQGLLGQIEYLGSPNLSAD